LKVGIMGGTFDPIHIGHLVAAECAGEGAGLDEIWFLPTNVPPHKSHKPLASAEQRWEMVNLAIAGNPCFRANDIELKREGTSYTIDTVIALSEAYPGYAFHYIIGADMVMYLPSWHRIGDIVRRISFIGLRRPGFDIQLGKLPPAIGGKVSLVAMPELEISSTAIRERLQEALSVRYLLPEPVRTYIEEKRLYGPVS
jgi:nicotinate-nucleotide adenylyltransferase